MRIFLSVLFCLFCSHFAFAQLPGIAAQNAFSFENNTGSAPAVLANGGLVILYPTGGGTFNVPNVGSQEPSNGYEQNDVRVTVPCSDGTPCDYYGYITYLSPGQINVWASGALISMPFIKLANIGSFPITLQKKTAGVWSNISNALNVLTVSVVPHGSTAYVSGLPKLNADLYGYNGSSGYVFLRKTLSPGNNPRVYNGLATVLAFYVTGASPYQSYSICSPSVKIGGVLTGGLLLSTFVDSGYNGVQQINMLVPGSITDSTTIQLGGTTNGPLDNCSSPRFGNIGTIPNWQ